MESKDWLAWRDIGTIAVEIGLTYSTWKRTAPAYIEVYGPAHGFQGDGQCGHYRVDEGFVDRFPEAKKLKDAMLHTTSWVSVWELVRQTETKRRRVTATESNANAGPGIRPVKLSAMWQDFGYDGHMLPFQISKTCRAYQAVFGDSAAWKEQRGTPQNTWFVDEHYEARTRVAKAYVDAGQFGSLSWREAYAKVRAKEEGREPQGMFDEQPSIVAAALEAIGRRLKGSPEHTVIGYEPADEKPTADSVDKRWTRYAKSKHPWQHQEREPYVTLWSEAASLNEPAYALVGRPRAVVTLFDDKNRLLAFEPTDDLEEGYSVSENGATFRFNLKSSLRKDLKVGLGSHKYKAYVNDEGWLEINLNNPETSDE